MILDNRAKMGRYLRISILWILAIMTLMRLVWMQRRSYDFETQFYSFMTVSITKNNNGCAYNESVGIPKAILKNKDRLTTASIEQKSWFISPYYLKTVGENCKAEVFDAPKNARFNQWSWVAVVFFCALATRLVGMSWLVCLLAVTTLMSRGNFIASIALLGSQINGALFVAILFSSLVLFLRTSSWILLVFFLAMSSIAVTVDKSLFCLTLVPLIISVLTRLFRYHGSEVQPESGELWNWKQLFRLRSGGWAVWNSANRNWLKISWWSGFLTLIQLLALIAVVIFAHDQIYGDLNFERASERMMVLFQTVPLLEMFKNLISEFDIHYLASMTFICIGALYIPSSRGFLGHGCRVFLLFFGLILMSATFFDYLDYTFLNGLIDEGAWQDFSGTLRFQEMIFWTEPVLISLGLCVFWHLLSHDVIVWVRKKFS